MTLADGVEKSSAYVVFKSSATTAFPLPPSPPQHIIYTSGACINCIQNKGVCVFAPAPYLPEK